MVLGDLRAAATDFTQALKAYRTWSYFGLQNVILRYRRTTLGPIWISIGMLSSGFAMSVVFGGLFGQPIREVLPYILGGIMMYYYFAAPLVEGVDLFLNAGGLITSRASPFMSHVFQAIITTLIVFAHNLVGFYVLIAAVGAYTLPHWTFVPALLLLTVFITFASALTGMLGARFRDMRFLLPYLAQVMFFVTPIFWDPANISGPRRVIVDYNPFYYMLNLSRGPLLGEPARLADWIVTFGVTVVTGLLFFVFFARHRRRIVFWL